MSKLIKQPYPYAWLDEVVEVTLNPERTSVNNIEVGQLEFIEGRFDKELQGIFKELKATTFYLFSSKKIKTVVAQYYNSLQSLEHQAMLNLAGYPDGHPLAAIGENIILSLQSIGLAFKRRYGKYITDKISKTDLIEKKPIAISRLLCKLSVDQIGIVLKAADDTKVIIASSISIIFRSIVPFLSTENRKNISWNSMRKSTYHIEQIDKEVVIATLEKLILKIKDY